jgi:hypothetical protein
LIQNSARRSAKAGDQAVVVGCTAWKLCPVRVATKLAVTFRRRKSSINLSSGRSVSPSA